MNMRIGLILILLVPVLAGVGCAPTNEDMLYFLREHEHEVSAIEYRVGIPDGIGISAPQVIEIDSESQVIQPDGKITLALLGEVKVVGMTAREIAAKLEVLLSRYYIDPKVSVRVTGYASKKYYVYGPVTSTGPRPYTGRDTLLDAVVAAGVDYRSWTSRVKVIRPSHDETEAQTIVVDVNKMLKQGDWSMNLLLEPDDVVYIPPTPLAWVGLRIQEILQPISPVAEAYRAPAEIIQADRAYDDRYNNDYDNESRSPRRTFGR